MLSLPFLPQLARTFKLDNHSRVSAINSSFVTFHPTDTEGNVPYLLLIPKRLEPSRRIVA